MKAIICDRCWKVEKAAECSIGFKQYELCESCAKSFKSWVDMKKVSKDDSDSV